MTANEETLGFQTEVKQLLHLMVHSLYSNREIFLRELISNANDACDKLRFLALDAPDLMEADAEMSVRISVDPESKELVISDNGIGMTRDDVISNLGTIAKSGTAEFIKNLSGDSKQDANLIGQFGVGFYSAFIVADRVVVRTRRAGNDAADAVEWSSDGDGQYTIKTIEKAERGTEIRLTLKEDASEFGETYRIRHLVTKYSDHVSIPVYLKNDVEKDDESEAKSEWDQVNQATALWTRPRTEITDEEYTEFYKHVAHDFEDPMTWSHHKVEGKSEYTGLLYVPARAPYDLWNRESPRGLKLYVQRVFIMDRAEEFLPLYLRFIRGVVDSSDLSLNVSREILQKDARVEAMKSAVTRRALDMLAKLAKDDSEKYQKFWEMFGECLKEGPAEDHQNKERITKLLRFASTHASTPAQNVGVEDYIARMVDGQKDIYYLVAESHTNALGSPYLEAFKKRGIEVLVLSDRIDEWLMGHLQEYKDHQFVDVTRDGLELPGEGKDEKKEQKKESKEHKALIKRMKEALTEQVEDVKPSVRLTDSAAVLVLTEHDMGPQMRQIMEAAGQAMPVSKPILEINTDHSLLMRLESEADEGRFKELARLVFDHAQLGAEGKLDDAPGYLKRVNALLTELSV
ncbi:molecular chaperone HtpG [Litoricolaceae bacterium]|jgi:molecular chaperone HtpG|nr:molecular chaperone HtpG [Litorivicinaceae bacterium]